MSELGQSAKASALRVIEALRAGVASPRASSHFSHGREDILDQVQLDLDIVQSNGQSRGMVISASYGQGKTHLLNQVAAFAQKRGYAVAKLVISKEAPIHNTKLLYQKLASSVILPGERDTGLDRQLATLRPSSQVVQDLFYMSAKTFHPKINLALQSYFLSTDTYDQFLLYGDLIGDFLPINSIREAIKKATGARDKIPRLPTEAIGQYFLLLGALLRALKCKGLVLLFDEAELVGALGVISRMKAYLNMAALLGLGGPFATRHFYSVFFFASGFYSDVIVAKREIESVKNRGIEKFGEHDANTILSVLDFLLTERIELTDLSQTQVEQLLLEVQRLHGIAYSWDATLDLKEVVAQTQAAPLRTIIRGAVEWLDVAYLYHEKPLMAFDKVSDVIPQEDEELFETESVLAEDAEE